MRIGRGFVLLCCSVSLNPAGHVPLKSTETPAVKKKHRRTRSGVRGHDASADAGNSHCLGSWICHTTAWISSLAITILYVTVCDYYLVGVFPLLWSLHYTLHPVFLSFHPSVPYLPLTREQKALESLKLPWMLPTSHVTRGPVLSWVGSRLRSHGHIMFRQQICYSFQMEGFTDLKLGRSMACHKWWRTNILKWKVRRSAYLIHGICTIIANGQPQ